VVLASDTANDLATDHGVGRSNLVYGLDSLRFFTAMWVAFSHGANFPIASYMRPEGLLGKASFLISKTMFNGTAAVAVFVISGFLIHGANVKKEKIDVFSFLMRRCVRIILPLFAISILAYILGSRYVDALNDVLWSVYAEIIYYVIYPVIFKLVGRFGIERVLLISFTISMLMIIFKSDYVYLWSFRNGLTWLFCLPLWLAGCLLAEKRGCFAKASEKFQ
jgi:peptidoglycan/LPS O-acetylase OafA/YrhL